MPRSWSVTLIFVVIELLGVGGLGAWAANRFGFNYALLTPVSFLVYALAGFFVARANGSAALAGAVVAALDALSWATFGGVGPQPAVPDMKVGPKAVTVLFVTGTACYWASWADGLPLV